MLNMILNRGKWTCCLWQLHSSSAFHLKKLTKGGTSAPSVSSLSSLWWWLVSTSVDQCPVSSKPSPVHTFLLKQMHHLHRLISLDLVNNWGFSSASSFLGRSFPPPIASKKMNTCFFFAAWEELCAMCHPLQTQSKAQWVDTMESMNQPHQWLLLWSVFMHGSVFVCASLFLFGGGGS